MKRLRCLYWSLLLILIAVSSQSVEGEEEPKAQEEEDSPIHQHQPSNDATARAIHHDADIQSNDKQDEDRSPFLVVDNFNCQKDRDGTFQCQFTIVPKEDETVDVDAATKIPTTIGEFCMDQDTGVSVTSDEDQESRHTLCVEAGISTQRSTSEAVEEKQLPASKALVDDDNHAAAKKDSQLSRILDEYYNEPLAHYGKQIIEMLNGWTPDDERASLKEYTKAGWWHELGVAHTKEASGEKDNKRQQMQVNWALNAFQRGIFVYKSLSVDNVSGDPWFEAFRKIRMAINHYEIAEVLVLSSDRKKQRLLKQHLEQAHRLFSTCHDALMEKEPTMDRAKQTDDPTKWSSLTSDHFQEGLHELWRRARASWAYTCLHLGTLEIDRSGSDGDDESNAYSDQEEGAENMGNLQDMIEALMVELGDKSPEIQAEAVQELLQAHLPNVLATVARGDAYFAISSKLYRLLLENDGDDETRQTARYLAHSQQNRGTTALSKGHLVNAQTYMEDALNLQINNVEALEKLTNPTEELRTAMLDIKAAIGEILYNLSDVYFQQGMYNLCNEKYTAAMDWYKNHNLTPLQHNELLANADESIRQYEAALEEYHELFSSGQANIDYASYEMGQDGLYYEKDDGYEADLHSALGAFYMTTGDLAMAAVHLEQAIQLYTNVGESRGTVFAEILYNQALMLFRQYNFDRSSEVHRRAVEIYREVVGEGNHPYLSMIDLSTYQKLLDQAQADVEKGMELNTDKDVLEMSINPLEVRDQHGEQLQQAQNSEPVEVLNAGANANTMEGPAVILTAQDSDMDLNETELIDNIILPIHGAHA